MIARYNRLAVAAVLLLLAGACSDESFTKMVHVSPGAGYETQLIEDRAVRDAYFADSPESPLLPEERKNFTALEYFDADSELYFVGDLQVYLQPEALKLVTTAGEWRDAERVGFVEFRIDNRPHRLQVYSLVDGSGSLFLPFQDGTTGQDTYPAGRYINLIASSPDGPYELDFNRAYNPSCAYGEADRFACPATPPENRLDVRIEAGERGRQHVEVQGSS